MRRRHFLLGALGTLAVPLLLRSKAHTSRAPLPSPRGFSGRWLTTGEEYETACSLYNPRLQLRPRAIAAVAHRDDIAAALAYGREQGLTIAIRGSGHSYQGHCFGPDVVVDTRALRRLSYRDEILTTEAACRFQDLLETLEPVGRAIPCGTCPTVGVMGYALGGGLSLLGRKLGMGVDRLRKVEFVSATGAFDEASEGRHPDLFWALRGAGGGNFVVATGLEFETCSVPQVVLDQRTFKGEGALSVIQRWQSWLAELDPRIGTQITLRHSGGPWLRVIALFLGTLAEWKSLGPLASWGGEGWDKQCTLRQALVHLGGPPSRKSPPFWATSDFFQRQLEPGWFRKAFRQLSQPTPCVMQMLALGGAIDSVAPEATAYMHRKGNLLLGQAMSFSPPGTSPQVAQQWIVDYRRELKEGFSGFAYQNYPDHLRPRWDVAYYGSNLKRLREVKARWDPERLFCQSQGLEL